jgi:hypothetical protein
MIEKKPILCGILAIALGIATIIPLEYMMAAQAQENTPPSTIEVPQVEPLFSGVNITYAYCNPNSNIQNDTVTLYGSSIEAVVNFTVSSDALKNADAQVEYYEFAVSSDQGPIINMGYYILLESDSYFVVGMGGPNGTIDFANGLTFDGLGFGKNIDYGCGGAGLNYGAYDWNYTMGYVSKLIFGSESKNLPQAAIELRNAQTVFIDVSKLGTVTVKGNVTVTTPSSDQILQHIELTKTDEGFIYGNYPEETPFPLPIGGP